MRRLLSLQIEKCLAATRRSAAIGLSELCNKGSSLWNKDSPLWKKHGVTWSLNGFDPRSREGSDAEALLKASARSRAWMETILSGKAASLYDIAANEGLAERHVRRLAVLAFLSPKVIQAIADGAAPSGVTVSSLTLALPHGWADQERLLGLG